MATTQSRKSAAQSAAAQAVDFDPQAALAGLEEDTPVVSPAAQTAIPNGRTGGNVG